MCPTVVCLMPTHPTRRTVLKSAGVGGIGLGVIGTATARQPDLRRQLGDIRRVTRKYRDPSVATGEGFVPGPNDCGGGVHYALVSRRVNAATVDLLEPEVILYGVNGQGDHVLAGVEYELREDLRDPDARGVPPDVFSDEGEDLKVSEADGWRLVGPVGSLGKIWAIHVWVHLPNPNGLFAPCQPTGLFRRSDCVPNPLCGGSL